jgi:hypothetical protein
MRILVGTCLALDLGTGSAMSAFPRSTGGVVTLSGQLGSSSSRTKKWTVLGDQRQSLWLRAEHLAIFVGALWLYAQERGGWLLFVLLFAIPDLSLLTGVLSRYAAAAAYNVAHSYVLGVGLALVGFYTSDHSVFALALAWIAHISFDRSIGLGYPVSARGGRRAGHRQEHQGGLI